MSVSFLQISDLHYRNDPEQASPPFSKVLSGMDPPLRQLRELLTRLDRPLDFVLITGDLVHDGGREDYISLKAQLDEILPVPYYVVSGNHDDLDLVREVFLFGGELSYVRELPGTRLVALNTASKEYPDGVVGSEELRFLEQIPKSEKPTFLFTHHHLLQDQFVLPQAQGAEKLLPVLERMAVQAVLCGHTHHYFHAEIGSIPYYTSGSLSFSAENGCDGELSFYQNSSATLFEYSDGILRAEPIQLAPARLLCEVKM